MNLPFNVVSLSERENDLSLCFFYLNIMICVNFSYLIFIILEV
jgi:hypothetical protein